MMFRPVLSSAACRAAFGLASLVYEPNVTTALETDAGAAPATVVAAAVAGAVVAAVVVAPADAAVVGAALAAAPVVAVLPDAVVAGLVAFVLLPHAANAPAPATLAAAASSALREKTDVPNSDGLGENSKLLDTQFPLRKLNGCPHAMTPLRVVCKRSHGELPLSRMNVDFSHNG